MEFKSNYAREQLVQVLNKSQLVELWTVHQCQQTHRTYEIRFSWKLRVYWLRINLHSKLFSSLLRIKLSTWFWVAKVGGCARKKYWFQRLAWKQSWCHGSLIHSGPLLSEGLRGTTVKCYKCLTQGIKSYNPRVAITRLSSGGGT